MDVCNRDNVYLQLVNRQGKIGRGELYRLVPCCHIIMQKNHPYEINMLCFNLGAIFILRKVFFWPFPDHPPTPVRNSKYFDIPPCILHKIFEDHLPPRKKMQKLI